MPTRTPSGSSTSSLETTIVGESSDGLGSSARMLAGETEAESLDRGAHLGRYTVLERIGAGGMGVVYGAFDPQLDRKVALKVMHPRSGKKGEGTGGRSRLLREAQAMAKLSHPNVITVHDVGTFGDRVFVAMEFIDGSTVREWQRQQHRDWAEIIEAFVKAGRGLAAAHAIGLVHRDFKPDNVLVGRDGRVLVMDFGLARTAGAETPSRPGRSPEQSASRDMVLTRTGALLGTPAYMAPEQHNGSKPDPYADQFSFCVALYEALYGERPFDGNSVTSLAMNVLDGQLRAPPKNSGVPTWLRRVVVRGLATRPEDRWPSIDALLAELQRDPIDRRPPWIAVGAALAVGGLITGAYLASRPKVDDQCASAAEAIDTVWNEATAQATQAALLSTGLASAQDISDAVAEQLRTYARAWHDSYRLHCNAALRPVPRSADPNDVPALLCLEVAKTDLDAIVSILESADVIVGLYATEALESLPPPAECADGAELVASDLQPRTRQAQLRAKLATARAQLHVGHPSAALERADGVVSGAGSLDDAGLAASGLLVRARAHRALGSYAAAERDLERAVIQAGVAGLPRLESEIWIALASLVGHAMDRRGEGRRLTLAAEAALARAGNPGRLAAALRVVRGHIALAAGHFELAAEAFETALVLREQEGLVDDLNSARMVDNLGLALEGLGHFELAMETQARAVQIREHAMASQHPALARSLAHLGSAMLGADYPGKAEASFARARWILDTPSEWPLDLLQRDPSPDAKIVGRQFALASADLEDRAGLLHRAAEEFEEAEESHRRAVALLEQNLSRNHRALGYPLNNLGLALVDQGRAHDALAPLRRAASIWGASLPRAHPDLAIVHQNLGNALFALGNTVDAALEYEIALETWERSLPEGHSLIGYALTGIGRCALASQDFPTAIDRLERALAIRDNAREDELNVAETALFLGQALWADGRDPARARELAARARDLVGAYEPSDPAGIERLLDGEVVVRLTDQLTPAGLGATNANAPL